MIIFEATIPGRVPVKKNTARKYRFRVVYSDGWQKWEQLAIPIIKKAMRTQKEPYPIKEYCRAEFKFYFKNHQWEADVSNLIEGPQDVLESCGVLKNDKMIQYVKGEKHFGDPNPRVEITIRTL